MVLLQAPEEFIEAVEIQQPPKARASTPIKPVFFVDREFSEYREKITLNGGCFNPEEKQWEFNGHTVCDGWDIEGNVFQLRR